MYLNVLEVSDLSERFYTVKELAERLHVNERTIRNLIKDGYLASYKVGRITRISEEQVNSYLELIKTK